MECSIPGWFRSNVTSLSWQPLAHGSANEGRLQKLACYKKEISEDPAIARLGGTISMSYPGPPGHASVARMTRGKRRNKKEVHTEQAIAFLTGERGCKKNYHGQNLFSQALPAMKIFPRQHSVFQKVIVVPDSSGSPNRQVQYRASSELKIPILGRHISSD